MSETVGHEESALPSSPQAGGAVAYNPISKELQPLPSVDTANGAVIPPASSGIEGSTGRQSVLELEDGTVYQGYNFGAEKSVAGELVFQTGMVGYPESITDPSYRGQILVVTFPLVGNYGVPSRETMDELLKTLPKYFESTQIHIAALVVATYAGENYSHFLAESSLGQWLKEQGVPAIHGIDTRALTKRIRQKGSMLGRMLLRKADVAESDAPLTKETWKSSFEQIDWADPNTKNLVDEGELLFHSLV
jgi:carbamoyl-phosphate synthase/aspartate carbamoyltransferase